MCCMKIVVKITKLFVGIFLGALVFSSCTKSEMVVDTYLNFIKLKRYTYAYNSLNDNSRKYLTLDKYIEICGDIYSKLPDNWAVYSSDTIMNSKVVSLVSIDPSDFINWGYKVEEVGDNDLFVEDYSVLVALYNHHTSTGNYKDAINLGKYLTDIQGLKGLDNSLAFTMISRIAKSDPEVMENGIRIALDVLQEDSTEALAYRNAALYHFINEDYKQALTFNLKGLRHSTSNTDSALLYFDKASIYEKLGMRCDSAMSCLTKAIYLDVESFYSSIYLANLQIECGMTLDAIETFIRAKKYGPESKSFISVEAVFVKDYYETGYLVYYTNKIKDNASFYLSKLLEIEPNNKKYNGYIIDLEKL